MKRTVILSLALSLTMGAAATTPTTADTVSVTPTSPTSPYTPYTPLRPTYLKGVLVSSPWTTNWFLQASVGTTVFLGTPLGCNDLFGRMRPAFSVALGKWFTPSVGGRITYGGPQFTDCTNSSQHYQYLRADFLWNVLGTQYKEDIHALSRWSLIPFVGLGILHNKDNAHKPLAISYGIQAQFHLSRRLALTAEIGSMTTMQDFDGIGKPHRLGDHLLSASASPGGSVPSMPVPTSPKTTVLPPMQHPCPTPPPMSHPSHRSRKFRFRALATTTAASVPSVPE